MKKLLLGLFIGLIATAYAAVPITFPINGGTGTNCKPTLGQVLVGNSSGTYNCQATSTLGISGSLSGGTTGWLSYWTSPTTLSAFATGTPGQLLIASSTSASGFGWTATSSLGISGGSGSGNSAWTIGSGLIYNATSTDKVGIGTSTPAYPLTVVGTSSLDSILSNRIGISTLLPNAQLEIKQLANSFSNGFRLTNTLGNRFNFAVTSNNDLAIGYNESNNLYLSSSGNLGIGTTTASTKLVVVGTSTLMDTTINGNLVQYKNVVTVGYTNADYIVDGTSDDIQINQAIAQVSSSNGGVIHLKNGTYNITASTSLSLPSNTIFECAGWGTVINLPTKSALVVDNKSGVIIKNCKFNSSTQTPSVLSQAIHIKDSSYVYVDTVRVENANSFGIFIASYNASTTNSVWVQNSFLNGLGSADVIGGGPSNDNATVKDIHILNNKIVQDPTLGIFYGNAFDIVKTYRLFVIGNEIGGSLALGNEQAPNTYTIISNNHIQRVPGQGAATIRAISLSSATSSQESLIISNNIIENGGIAVQGTVTASTTRIKISENIFNGTSSLSNIIELDKVSNSIINGNIVTYGTNGISLTNSNNNNVYGNSFSSSTVGIKEIATSNYNLYQANYFNPTVTTSFSLLGASSTEQNNFGGGVRATLTAPSISNLPTITASSFFGIATSTPSQSLTVAGNQYLTGAFFDSTNASGTLGMILQTTGTGTRWVATSTLGITGGSSSSTVPSINGLATTTFSFATTSDTNIGLSIATSSTGLNFISQWIGTLADSRITSSSNWNAAFASTTALTPSYFRGLLSATYPVIYNSTTGIFSSGFSTSTTNVFTGLNTFQATTTLASTTITYLGIGNINPLAILHASNPVTASSFGQEVARFSADTPGGTPGSGPFISFSNLGTTVAGKIQAISESSNNVGMAFSNFKSGALTEIIRLAANGNVGIGTTTPIGRIHVDSVDTGIPLFLGNLSVAANTNIVSLKQVNGGGNSATTSALQIIDNRGNNPTFYSSNNGSNPFVILSNGNVGIGTSSPTQKLTVVSTSSLRDTIPETTNTYSLGASSTRWASLWSGIVNVGTSTWSLGQIGTRFGIFPQAQLGGTEAFSILSDGKVGIGSTTPSDTLSVNGSINVTGSVKVNGTPISVGTSTADYIISKNGTNVVVYDTTANTNTSYSDFDDAMNAIIPTATSTGRSNVVVRSGIYAINSSILYSGNGTVYSTSLNLTGAGGTSTLLVINTPKGFDFSQRAKVNFSNLGIAVGANTNTAFYASTTSGVMASIMDSSFSDIIAVSTTTGHTGYVFDFIGDFRNNYENIRAYQVGNLWRSQNNYSNAQFINGDSNWYGFNFCEINNSSTTASGVCWELKGNNGQVNQVIFGDINGISNDSGAGSNDVFLKLTNATRISMPSGGNAEQFATTTQVVSGNGIFLAFTKYVTQTTSATGKAFLDTSSTAYNVNVQCKEVELSAATIVWSDKNTLAGQSNRLSGINGGNCIMTDNGGSVVWATSTRSSIEGIYNNIDGSTSLAAWKVLGDKIVMNFSATMNSYLSYMGGAMRWIMLGTERMTLTDAGNLGLGSTTPIRTLSVVGSQSLSGAFYDSLNSAGGAGECLTSTGSATDWASCGGGGGLSGGSTGLLALWSSATTLAQSLFMDNGTVTGIGATSTSARFNIASTTGDMMWAFGTNGQLSIATTTATTSIETGILGQIKLSALTYAGRDVLATKIASSSSSGIQAALWDKQITRWGPGATNGVMLGSSITALTTATALAPTAVNKYTTFRRSRWASVVTTANQQVGLRTDAQFFRSATSTNSGWFYKATFGIDNYTANDRFFVGLSTCTTACLTGTTTLTNLANTIGFGVEGATSQFVFLTNDGSGAISTTTISGLPTLATNNGYHVYMYNPPTSSIVYWRIDNVNTGAMVAEGNVTTNLPANNTFMTAQVACSNALNAAANACQIGLASLYIEQEK